MLLTEDCNGVFSSNGIMKVHVASSFGNERTLLEQ